MAGEKLLTGKDIIKHLVHSCQRRIVKCSNKAHAYRQAGNEKQAQAYERLATLCNQELQQYWAAGAEQIISEVSTNAQL